MANRVGVGQTPSTPPLASGQVLLQPDEYDFIEQAYSGQTATQTAPPVTALGQQTAIQQYLQSQGINPSARSGGGEPSIVGGNTEKVTLSDGRTLLIDQTDGHVIATYGDAQPDKYSQERQLQQERFAHEDAQSDKKYQQSRELRDTDPALDPWRQMMPRYTAPSPVQGERGSLDIIDPNTGQLIAVRQPEAPPVRVVGGNLIVDPGANAAVYYNGNKGQATNVSGGPQMFHQNASFPSAMSQAEQIASRIQNKGGGGGGASGGMGGGARNGGGNGGGNRFGAPSAGLGGMSNPASNRFADPLRPMAGVPMRPPWESDSWVDPYQQGGIPRPPWESPDWVDPFGDAPSTSGRMNVPSFGGYGDTAASGSNFGPDLGGDYEVNPLIYGTSGNWT